MPVPEAKPEAEARMRYDLEHQERRGLLGRALGAFSKRPDVSMASKAGEPVLLPGGRPGEAGMTDVRAAPADAAGGTGIRLEAVPLSTETPAPATPGPAAPPATQPPAQPQKPDSGGAPTEQAALTPPANTPAAAAAPSSDKPADQPQPNAKNTKKKEKKKKGK
jgi:hypothetical protein